MSLLQLFSVLANRSDPLSVSISPSSLSESDQNCPLTSSSLTGTGAGGAGGYSYAWDFSIGGIGLTIDSPSNQSTTLSVSSGQRFGTLRCTVTDSNLDTAEDTISVSLECGGL